MKALSKFRNSSSIHKRQLIVNEEFSVTKEEESEKRNQFNPSFYKFISHG